MDTRRSYGVGSLTTRTGAGGVTVWVGQWQEGERRRKRTLGPCRPRGGTGGLTRRDAEQALGDLVRDARTTTARRRGFADLAITVEQAALRYVDHLDLLGRKPTTTADYRSAIRARLAPWFGGRALAAVTVDDVEAFVRHCQGDGLAAKSVVNHLTLLSGVMTYAAHPRRRWCRENVVAQIENRPHAVADVEPRFLDETEFAALLGAVPDDVCGPTDRLAYQAAAMTGCRRGELAALRWRDVDWTAGVIRVSRSYTRPGGWSTPKSGKGRAVPLAPSLAADLERHSQRSRWTGDDDLILADPRTGDVYYLALYRRYRAALARAGVRPLPFHALRHVFGTRMASAGAPMRAVQTWMGHADLTTTQRYAKWAADPSEGARWAERAFGGPTPPPAVPQRSDQTEPRTEPRSSENHV